MNYGRFFRLNQSLSKVVDGVAIYDYIELPAYFGPSEENEMSPKYPVSVTITSDSVRFRLHYSVYKVETDLNSEYGYSVDDIHQTMDGSTKGIKMAHMEEVIFELPYINDATDRLTSTIKELYSTRFPQRIDDNRAEGLNNSGGRFLEQLIRKRFPHKGEGKTDSIENRLYSSMREALDKLPSYSSLWLMDLICGDQNGQYIDVYEKGMDKEGKDYDRNIVGFLRKLLLDFMFDLKHSDVFQNSKYYQTMYSGLMSDFYFSALMHKCEYYYYRDLTEQAIKGNGKVKANEQDEKERIKAITTLYAEELVKAENLWIQDIMNPQAEKDFEYRYPGKHKILREFLELYNFTKWPSWFAEPEEEMRRVCFTMRDKTGKKHICNADTLVKYLDQNDEKDKSFLKLIDLKNDNKEKISKWFLKQYDFNDVLHLHWFRHLNAIFVFAFAIPALASLFTRDKLLSLNSLYYLLGGLCVILSFAVFAWLLDNYGLICESKFWRVKRWKIYKSQNYKNWKKRIKKSFLWQEDGKTSGILKARCKRDIWDIIWFVVITAIICILINYREYVINILTKNPLWLKLLPFAIVIIVIILEKKFSLMSYLISRLHMFLPKLVASITLSWITLSTGFDLYLSFFDNPPRLPYIICIVVIVMLFVMYEINRITPHASPLRKFWRSFELMIISYFISLAVGFVVINFLGEKYLERGGYINDFYSQHVDSTYKWIEKKDSEKAEVKEDTCWKDYANHIIKDLNEIKIAVNDTNSHVRLVEKLNNVTNKQGNKVVDIENYNNGVNIFVLRDFLVMFSFITMFIGIFIQLIIFGDNKQMTEL